MIDRPLVVQRSEASCRLKLDSIVMVYNETEEIPLEKYNQCNDHILTYYLTSPVHGFYRYTHALVVVVNILFSVIGTLANILVVASYMKNPRLKTSSNYMIVVLAINDLMVTTFVQPLVVAKTVKEIFGTHNCVLWTVIMTTAIFCSMASLMTITVLSVERCITLAYPYHYQTIITVSRLNFALLLAWFLQLLLVISSFTAVSEILFVLPEVIIIMLSVSTVAAIWIWIHRLIRRHKVNINNLQAPSHNRATKTSYLIVAVVLCCYSPAIVLKLYHLTEPIDFFLLLLIGPLIGTITFANSTLNPLILFWRKRTFRETARQLFVQNETKRKETTVDLTYWGSNVKK